MNILGHIFILGKYMKAFLITKGTGNTYAQPWYKLPKAKEARLRSTSQQEHIRVGTVLYPTNIWLGPA